MGIGEILNTLIGTFVGAGLAFWSSFYLYNYKYNVAIEGSATILYSDIEDSLKLLKLTKEIILFEDEFVLNKPHFGLVDRDNFRNLIIDLRNKLNSKHIKRMLVYYSNLELLENYRVEYWSSGKVKQSGEIYIKYQHLLNEVYDQSKQLEFIAAFKEVKKYSAFKNDD